MDLSTNFSAMNSGPQWMSDWYEKSLNLFNRINDPITNFSELDKESLIDYDSIHISDSLDLSVAIVKIQPEQFPITLKSYPILRLCHL